MFSIFAYVLGAIVGMLITQGHLNPGVVLLCLALVCSVEIVKGIEQ